MHEFKISISYSSLHTGNNLNSIGFFFFTIYVCIIDMNYVFLIWRIKYYTSTFELKKPIYKNLNRQID